MPTLRRISTAAALSLAAAVLFLPARARAQASDAAAIDLIERAASAYGSARTLQAQFSQTLSNPRANSVQAARGEFFQQGTTKFAFKFTEPAPDRIVADGEIIWLYMPSAAPGQALKIPRAAGGGLDLAASILRTPRDRYTARALGDTMIDGRRVSRISLTPKANDASFRTAELWIDPADALVRRAVLAEPMGLIRTIDFTNVRIGEPLPADAFVFTPPAGVRVIDQQALLGGSTPTKRP